MGLDGAVISFTRPVGQAPMDGPEPHNGGTPINAASDEGAFTYWLDRMVRSRHQLVERLALVFHDWWATRRDGVNTNAEMLNQTNVFRAHGLGSFRDMTRAVTTDPAMLQFLNGMSNRRGAVNENYARELMELFTLGADRGAYTETDVRELARALTGWRADYDNGWVNWRWDQAGRWDFQNKTVFGKTGRFNWQDACELVLTHPHAPVVLRRKAVELLHPDAAERRGRGRARAALRRPAACRSGRCWRRSSARPTSTRPADGQAADRALGRAAARDRSRDREPRVVVQERPHRPADLLPARRLRLERPALAGHQHDASAAGSWSAWRWRAGWSRTPAADTYPEQSAADALAAARAFWGDPDLTPETVAQLLAFAQSVVPATGTALTLARLRAQRFNALRQLIAAGPDYQTC